jgi:three-Cys-motif partner protein
MGDKPTERFVEERDQTQHKLETMQRYFGAWATIIARATRTGYCNRQLWIIDTHAGQGIHLSATDPDGEVAGTPLLALLAARKVQAAYPATTVHVRATDTDKGKAEHLWELVKASRGEPPADMLVAHSDWARMASRIIEEIEAEAGCAGSGPYPRRSAHAHRSLWFIDPYGIEGIDHDVIRRLPPGSEVIVNLDLMALLRDVGRADQEPPMREILERAFGGSAWRGRGSGEEGRQALAQAFADTFPASQFRERHVHRLRPSGSQDRALIHLSGHPTAATEFAKKHATALRSGTVLATGSLTQQERHAAAKRLHQAFKGETLTIREMRETGLSGLNLGQLRTVCCVAAELGYGSWTDPSMAWHAARIGGPRVTALKRETQDGPGLFDS